MNILKASHKYWLLIIVFAFMTSCDEDSFLNENPKDFYSLNNSYQSFDNYQSALTDLYARVREIHHGGNQPQYFSNFLGTDVAKNARGGSSSYRLGDYQVWLNPTNGVVEYHWTEWYKVISNANTIISRIEDSQLSQSEQTVVTAEAKFFRGLAYRYLVYLYGGVPLITEELTSPKTDFARASEAEVLNQIVSDLQEAAANLPSIDQVTDGKVSNLVAQHFLAETYITLEQYDNAITAASAVIDDPNTALMTSRFGTMANSTPGDVYWDLFRAGNQNRSAGNTEALWVIQMEVDTPGGYLESSGGGTAQLERWAGPVHWLTFKDPDGNEGMSGPKSNLNTGGRGVSFMMNTDYWLDTIWQSDYDNDIRNAPHNIVRDGYYDNPESAWKDSSFVKYPSSTDLNQDWRWYPYPSKITTPGQHPDALFENKETLLLKSSAGATYRDRYLVRLAETYLLRAEAYLGKGETGNAADDINMVRERSNATPISAGDVTLDYILDERARELLYEEQRRITLHRTDTFVERVRAYNNLNSDDIEDHHGLWPIPFSEIEANKDNQMEQNPGY